MATTQDDIRETVAKIYQALANVTVITTVGGATAALTKDGASEEIRVDISTDDTAPSFVTQVDLVQGDIRASIPARAQEELPAALALHEKHVEQALTVLPGNIAALIKAGQDIIAMLDGSD